MKLILSLLFGCWEGFWRRWKGTASDDKWYNAKWFKTVLNVSLTFVALILTKHTLLQSLIADSNHKITDFEIKTVYRSADVNEVVLKEKIQYVSALPASPEPDVFYLIPQ